MAPAASGSTSRTLLNRVPRPIGVGTTQGMQHAHLELEPNEASDLCPVLGAEALRVRGWDRAFATILDEGPVERCVAVLGHLAGADPGEGWRAHRIACDAGDAEGKTDDGEVCVARDGVLYVLGSQFGSKTGPLEAARHFAARLDDEALAAALDGDTPDVEVARLRFSLHRAINDALAAAPVELLELGALTRERYIDATIRHGAREGKRWEGRVSSADQPVNVEGAAFRPGGALLLGLRHPVTAGGHPLLVELADVDELFDDPETPPRCSSVWVLEDVGTREEPVGVRALHAAEGDTFEVIVGNLDSTGKDSSILADHPGAGTASCAHRRFSLPLTAAGGPVRTELVRAFGDLFRVEGVARGPGGRWHYVSDEEGRVELRTLLVE